MARQISPVRSLNIAIEGCCHGELDAIYDTIRESGNRGIMVDLLLVCGDFQCVRNSEDLLCVSMPAKYRKLNTFQDYVTGAKVAPVTTIFIGGNHEASNLLQELYYGGWVAPNIYFLGFAGVVWFGGIKIAGLSGIFNDRHYSLGHYERPPYSEDAMRSVYHLRELEVYRMSHMANSAHPVDIFLSHDWPEGVWEYGDKGSLLRRKPYFAEDMASGKLGSPPLRQLLQLLRPSFWFAAHLHVKFAAVVPHSSAIGDDGRSSTVTGRGSGGSGSNGDTPDERLQQQQKQYQQQQAYCAPVGGISTRFLALDKVFPGRDFLQIISVPQQTLPTVNAANASASASANASVSASAGASSGSSNNSLSFDPDSDSDSPVLQYDAEWLATLVRTHGMLRDTRTRVHLPDIVQPPTAQEIESAAERIKAANGGSLVIRNLEPAPLPRSTSTSTSFQRATPPHQQGNAQTDHILAALGLSHIWTIPCTDSTSTSTSTSASCAASTLASAATVGPAVGASIGAPAATGKGEGVAPVSFGARVNVMAASRVARRDADPNELSIDDIDGIAGDGDGVDVRSYAGRDNGKEKGTGEMTIGSGIGVAEGDECETANEGHCIAAADDSESETIDIDRHEIIEGEEGSGEENEEEVWRGDREKCTNDDVLNISCAAYTAEAAIAAEASGSGAKRSNNSTDSAVTSGTYIAMSVEERNRIKSDVISFDD